MPYNFSDLNFGPPPTKKFMAWALMPDEERFEMREWDSINGGVVQQRSTRQEITMAKAGTLPKAAHRSMLQPSKSALEDPLENQEIPENEVRHDYGGEVLEFDGDSNSNNESSDEEENAGIQSAEIGRNATCLIGQSSCYGRVVRFIS